MKTFSISQALKMGWALTKQHFWLWVQILLTMALINIIIGTLADNSQNDGLELAITILGYVAQAILDLGLFAIILKALANQPVKYADLFAMYPYTGQMVIATLLVSIATAIGLMALIIPGIYIAMRLSQTGYVLADEKVAGVAAVRRSWAMTRGQVWPLFLFTLTIALLNVLGAMLLLIGLFVTLPVSMIAMGYVYRTLKQPLATIPVPVNDTPTLTPAPVPEVA